MDGRINNLPHLLEERRKLRNNPSPAKAKMWTMLQQRRLNGKKFRRQHSIGEYIIDFYCPAERLAIEIPDREYFYLPKSEYYHERDLYFARVGVRVVRFEEVWIWKDPEELLRIISNQFKFPPRPPATPPLK